MAHELRHVSKLTTTQYHYGRVIRPEEGEPFLWLSQYGNDAVEDAETQAQNANEMNGAEHQVFCVINTKEVYICATETTK